MIFSTKTKAIWIVVILTIVFTIMVLNWAHIYQPHEMQYGVTFSVKEARDLGLDWKQIFGQMLDDLGVRRLRLVAYWDEIESTPGKYDWSDLDWQIDEASQRQTEVILAIGGRLPRWPECHFPGWAKNLPADQRQMEQLKYVKAVIEHYSSNPSIKVWQIENEPFLPYFGECPPVDPETLDFEIELAKSLDSRPIMVTDSGELSIWVRAASRADIFGTTMYRDTYSQKLERYIHYPIGPWFFRMKKNIASQFAHPKDWVVIELEAEPWGPIPFQNMEPAERARTMDLKKLRSIVEFARQTGFQKIYLWGVEWWAWERDHENNPSLWDEARNIFSDTKH